MRGRGVKKIFFPTDFNLILDRVANIDAISYEETRNYINGAVSYLSPYISRGVISTKFVHQELIKRRMPTERILKFVQELAWRDYWQLVWKEKEEAINYDIKNKQEPVISYGVSSALHTAKTGIKAIDKAVTDLYKTGYLHNHLRMYIASIACNIGKNYWKKPAQWMYYHLLDADWASNALSWQWVAGSNSNKKYYANQENINTYCQDHQKSSFLDVSYDDFEDLPVPDILLTSTMLRLTTPLPKNKKIIVNTKLPTLIYNFYNLDPTWKKELTLNRILLLEPSVFRKYPVSKKSLDFVLSLSKNIEGIQVYVGEFDALVSEYKLERIRFKEHPLNKHYKGIEEERDWMFSVKGYHSSFFSFWKKCKKELKF